MLVTSAIILALAFLCSILTTETLTNGMRQWTQDTPLTKEYQDLKHQREVLDTEIKSLEGEIRQHAQYAAAPSKDAKPFDVKTALQVESWDEVKEKLGTLPVASGDLNKLLTAEPGMLESLKLLMSKSIERKAIREKLNLPEDLKALMTSKGVPTDPKEIEANKTQTKWIITLALMVAFVGILNAMLMSVTERFREIGTMKCLGALDGFIVKLFLLESLFQGTVGTVLGIVVGLAVSFGIAALSYGGAAFYHVLWNDVGTNVLITLGVGMLLSVSGAILPALQAARMEPIAAMRVDA